MSTTYKSINGVRKLVEFDRIDYRDLAILFILFTAVFVAAFIITLFLEKKYSSSSVTDAKSDEELKDQLKAMHRHYTDLKAENAQLKHQLKNTEMYKALSKYAVAPEFNINEILFADEDEIKQVLSRFQKQMELHVRYKIFCEYIDVAKRTNGNQ